MGIAMPFDSTTLRQPTVTVQPPEPSERGGGPRRIRIKIVQRPQPAQRYGWHPWRTMVLLAPIAAALFGCASTAAADVPVSAGPLVDHVRVTVTGNLPITAQCLPTNPAFQGKNFDVLLETTIDGSGRVRRVIIAPSEVTRVTSDPLLHQFALAVAYTLLQPPCDSLPIFTTGKIQTVTLRIRL
jgi:hypothetical protein